MTKRIAILQSNHIPLTWDRGKEMGDQKRFTLATDIKVYFCDPQHLCQRGTNENTNGPIAAVFPQGNRPVGLLTSPAQCSSEETE